MASKENRIWTKKELTWINICWNEKRFRAPTTRKMTLTPCLLKWTRVVWSTFSVYSALYSASGICDTLKGEGQRERMISMRSQRNIKSHSLATVLVTYCKKAPSYPATTNNTIQQAREVEGERREKGEREGKIERERERESEERETNKRRNINDPQESMHSHSKYRSVFRCLVVCWRWRCRPAI